MNRYLAFIFAVLTGTEIQAQVFKDSPKLIINITIDQLRTDYLEAFSSLYSEKGFRKLLQNGTIYESSQFSFLPVDGSSAVASIATGTTPFYHGIISSQWLDRKTLRPTFCVDDYKYTTAPSKLKTSTISDELKIYSNGKGLSYSIATNREAAVLAGGHSSDGTYWIDSDGLLTTSSYYSNSSIKWANAYNKLYAPTSKKFDVNQLTINAAKQCLETTSLGKDNITDYLSIFLSAKPNDQQKLATTDDIESIYRQLDNLIGDFVSDTEKIVSKDRILFVINSTGYYDEPSPEYAKFNIPNGTFYINRAANLLNIYLGAIYGQGHYVESCFHNEIYLNKKLIEQKRINWIELLNKSQELLIQTAGVNDVFTSHRLISGNNNISRIRNGFNPKISGDIIIEVSPGWQLKNEDNLENYSTQNSYIPYPIILYGYNVKPKKINLPVKIEQIAPTIAKAIHIRAPNACQTEPLQ